MWFQITRDHKIEENGKSCLDSNFLRYFCVMHYTHGIKYYVEIFCPFWAAFDLKDSRQLYFHDLVRVFWPKSITNFGERQSTSFAESGNFAEKTLRKIDPISSKTNRK